MTKRRITDTSARDLGSLVSNILYTMEENGIENQEARGQQELVNSSQLPIKWNSHSRDSSLEDQYKKMGIEITGSSDELFFDVILPEGWKLESTSHSMWNELKDSNGRTRAMIFYKAAFYDRDAFINFSTRYSYELISFLDQSENGHFEITKVKRKLPKRGSRNSGGVIISEWGYQVSYQDEDEWETVEEKTWIPRFKDSYEERNNSPIYYNIKDGNEIILSSKEAPKLFTKKYSEKSHSRWWSGYELINDRVRKEAEKYLRKEFPKYKDINSYWD